MVSTCVTLCGVLQLYLVQNKLWVPLSSSVQGQWHPHLFLQVTDIIAEGYAAQQVLLQLQSAVLADSGVADVSKAGALEALAAADKCLVDGADESLQLLHVSSQVQRKLRA